MLGSKVETKRKPAGQAAISLERAMQIALGKVNGRNRAYGLNRLLVPFEVAMPVLERDISAAIKSDMVELMEVVGPVISPA